MSAARALGGREQKKRGELRVHFRRPRARAGRALRLSRDKGRLIQGPTDVHAHTHRPLRVRAAHSSAAFALHRGRYRDEVSSTISLFSPFFLYRQLCVGKIVCFRTKVGKILQNFPLSSSIIVYSLSRVR